MQVKNSHTFHGLDHLRALAILLVCLFHYFILTGGQPLWLPEFARFGWTGVDLFFVLSGFLIASQLFQQIRTERKISFSSFFIKRFFRIIPAFLATVALYFLLPFFREKKLLPPVWKFLTFTQNFGLDLKAAGAFSHAWSLCVEEHFYLVLPLVLLVLQYTKRVKGAYWILIVLVAMGFVCRLYSFQYMYSPFVEEENSWVYWYKYIYYPTYNRLDGLLAGVSIAAMYHFLPTVWSRISRYGNIWIVVGISVLTSAYFLCYDQMTFYASIFGFPLVALGYGCVVIGALSPGCFLFKWKSRLTAYIATLSFAIYLTHKGVIHMTHLLLEDLKIDPNVMLCISVVTCIIFAFFINLLVERPFLKIRSILLKKLNKA